MSARCIHIVKTFDREPELDKVCSLAGRNNLLPRRPERYLYLHSFGTTPTSGKFRCDLFFTPLQSLKDLGDDATDSVNWRSWIGEGWEVAGGV